MVLESLVRPGKVEGKPWEMFFIGIVYSFFAIALSFWVFRGYASLVMVTFTAIAAIPFIYGAIQGEQQKESTLKDLSLLKEHGKIISMFTFLFLGFVVSFLVLFLVLPGSWVSTMFEAQVDAISTVRAAATGNFFANFSSLPFILLNNMKVLIFCGIFSFFYGTGAIFILSWNASVMGVAIGEGIKHSIGASLGTNLGIISTSLLGYFAHGLPEMVGFFVSGLAGGIISVALMREGYESEAFSRARKDALRLFLIAIGCIAIAGVIEVTVSPLFF
jgi:uncharacterized membrane protein SpoIIM required for sporulation